jgi:hypothetical protein
MSTFGQLPAFRSKRNEARFHEKARVTTANSRTPHPGVERQYDLKIVEEPSLVFSRRIFNMG